MILEANDAGELLIPAELLGGTPHVRIEAERHGDSLVLKPIDKRREKESGGILDRLPMMEGRLADLNDTFRREDMYGDDGR